MDTSDREPPPMDNTIPPESGPVRSYGWEWGREEDRRPQLPWIGIFLVVYGALLLIDRVVPQYLVAGNLLVLAAGLAFLIVWLLRRGTFPLYAGAFLTASAVPGVIEGATNTDLGEGFGTLCYGVALLFIGAVRMTRGGGVGWQALIGVLLVALGGSQLAVPEAAGLVLPLLLVVFGLVLLTRDRSGFRR
jgi:hypothetical protein